MNDDIINLPHFHAPGRPYMSMQSRAAQFMPFKSLNDYHEEISDKEKEILDDDWQVIEYESYRNDHDQDLIQNDGDDAW